MIQKLLATLMLMLTVGFTVLPFVPKERCNSCQCVLSGGNAKPVAMDPSCGLESTTCSHPVVVPLFAGTQPHLERIQPYLNSSWHPGALSFPITETSLLVQVANALPSSLHGFRPPLRL